MQRQNISLFTKALLAVSMSALCMTSVQAGIPVWTFSALTATTIAVQPGVSSVVQYKVTNQSSREKNLVLYPTQGVSQQGSCILAPKGTCTLTLAINGSQLPEGGVQGGPTLCQADANGNPNPNQCYQPSSAQALDIAKTKKLLAFVANDLSSGANNITRCEVQTDGSFSDCQIAAVGFNNPYGAAFNPDRSRLYITNYNNDTISVCDVEKTTGNLGPCQSQAGLSPRGVILNKAGNWIYIVNEAANKITRCSVDASNGSLSACNDSGTGLFGPPGITFNQAETRVYITNFNGGYVTRCNIDASGDLTACTNSALLFTAPVGIVFNPTHTLLYVVQSGGQVYKCTVLANGNLGVCTLAGNSLGTTSRFLVFNGTTRAYITNAGSDNVTWCDVNGDGDLENCANTGTMMDGATGIQLLPII